MDYLSGGSTAKSSRFYASLTGFPCQHMARNASTWCHSLITH